MKKQGKSAGSPASTVRTAMRKDAPRLLEMIAALADHHGDMAKPTLRALERDLFGPAACAQALVAESGGILVGYALLTSFPQAQWGLRLMDLNHLFVDPQQRGAGIGRHLVAAAVALARKQECGRMVVSTHPDNLKAQALYCSLGFQPRQSGGPRYGLELPANGALPAGWI